MSWIDSHCHLDFNVFADQKNLVASLVEAGCDHVLVPAISAQYFARVQQFKSDSNSIHEEFVLLALGLHPFFLSDHKKEDLVLLDSLLNKNRPNAVGEIGLDFALDQDTHEAQIEWFEAQVKLAIKYELAVVVHARKSHDKICSIFKRLKYTHGGIIHAFSGSIQQAQNYLKLGFVLGLGGALTYDRAKAMHKMVKALPCTGYVLETDSPDMLPAFAVGEVNTPLNIPKIAQSIAVLRGETLDKVYEDSSNNFKRIMR